MVLRLKSMQTQAATSVHVTSLGLDILTRIIKSMPCPWLCAFTCKGFHECMSGEWWKRVNWMLKCNGAYISSVASITWIMRSFPIRPPWLRLEDSNTIMAAARHGHLEVIQYLYKNGCRWDPESCPETTANVARHGHLEVMKYLHANGCPWHPNATGGAAQYGHLDVLKYLHENGCPWSHSATLLASINGHLDVI